MSETPSPSSDLHQVSRRLQEDLDLTSAPVQLSYLSEPLRDAPVSDHPSPSVCTYFALGQTRNLLVPLPHHQECEIGAFVLGMAPEGELGQRLASTVGQMEREGYLLPGEALKIPRNESPPNYVHYAPLGEGPGSPTAVLLFVRARSLMLVLEAANRLGGEWTPPPMVLRPMCSIVPVLLQGKPLAISVGCAGSRVYTGLSDGEMIVGVRGDRIAEFQRALHTVRSANDSVAADDARRRDSSPHALRPPEGDDTRSGRSPRNRRPEVQAVTKTLSPSSVPAPKESSCWSSSRAARPLSVSP